MSASSPVRSEPAVYWQFDEGQGDIAFDSMGSGDDVHLSGTSWSEGVRGHGLTFQGGSDRGVVENPASLKPSNALAITAWIRPSQVGADGSSVLSMGGGYGFRLQADGSAVFFLRDRSGEEEVASSEDLIGGWHHLVGQLDGGRLEIWVDGLLADSQTGISIVEYPAGLRFVLGTSADESPESAYHGVLDEVQVHHQALGRTQIESLAERPCGDGLTLCQGECVDLNSSPLNCGDCQNTCMAGDECQQGVCTVRCGHGTEEVDGGCRPLEDHTGCGCKTNGEAPGLASILLLLLSLAAGGPRRCH